MHGTSAVGSECCIISDLVRISAETCVALASASHRPNGQPEAEALPILYYDCVLQLFASRGDCNPCTSIFGASVAILRFLRSLPAALGR